MTPLVTIGLLTYNNERTIVRTLEGLVHQTYLHKELIIFDDGSTDNTYLILEQYAKKYPFIKLYKNQKNIGVIKNFEQLLYAIKGEYFLWACPDDDYHLDFLEKCMDVFRASPSLVSVLSSIRVFFESSDLQQFSQKFDYQTVDFNFYLKNKKQIRDSVIFRKNLEQYCMYIHGITKSSVIKNFIPLNGHYFSIEELFAAFFILEGGIGTVPEILCEKYQDLTPLKDRNIEAYKISYGLKNKLSCLLEWLMLSFKAPLSLKARWEFFLILLLLLKKHTIDSLFNKIIRELSLVKKIILKRNIN